MATNAVSLGQMLGAVFWGLIAVGRGLAIPLSFKVSISKQLAMDLGMSLVGCIVIYAGLAAEVS